MEGYNLRYNWFNEGVIVTYGSQEVFVKVENGHIPTLIESAKKLGINNTPEAIKDLERDILLTDRLYCEKKKDEEKHQRPRI